MSNLTEITTNFTIHYSNVLALWEKLTEALTTKSENVVVTLTSLEDGMDYNLRIPSINFLSQEIKRLDTNYKNLVSKESEIINSDGSVSNIQIKNKNIVPQQFEIIDNPKTFNVKNNWFFEQFIYPLLNIDFSYNYNSSCEVTKVLLNTSDQSAINFFRDNFYNKNDVNYNELLSLFQENNIDYIIDDEIIKPSIKESKFSGQFSILKIYNEVEGEINDINLENSQYVKYVFDILNYTNNLSEFKYSEVLSSNELLSYGDSIYKVIEVDIETNSVILELIEGYYNLEIGTTLEYVNSKKDSNTYSVSIGYDKYMVVFFRPIENNLISNDYSPGYGLYTNDLILDGENLTLSQFYKESVVDFGKKLFSLAKQDDISAIDGVKPHKPELLESNFSIVNINDHLVGSSKLKEIKILNENKKVKENELKVVSQQIKNKLNAGTQNNQLTDTKVLKSKYDNIVKEINEFNNKLVSNSETIATPKYRIRGFWDIPQPAYNESTTKIQNIVQFIIQYRYHNLLGESASLNNFTIEKNDGVVEQGVFSNWVEIKSPVRKRILNDDGVFEWETQNIANGDEVNINQLDIPINAGERVDIRIKSVSEAGFPSSPILSDWSDILTVEFDDVNNNGILDDLDEIRIQSTSDLQSQKIKEELELVGLNKHLEDVVEIGNRKFNHSALNIFSGKYTNDGNPLDLIQYLTKLEDIVNNYINTTTTSNYELSLIFNDKITSLQKNNTNKIFGGYYKDLVENETIPMGTIITQIYNLRIKNNDDKNLEITSPHKGSSLQYSDLGFVDGINYNYDKSYLTSLASNRCLRQRKNQIVFSRYISLTGENLYDNLTVNHLYDIDNSTSNCVVTNSTYSNLTLDDSYIFIHEDSQDVDNGQYIGDGIKFNEIYNKLNVEFNNNSNVLFKNEDKFLIGRQSCGSFLSLLVNDETNTNILVDGDTIFSKTIVESGKYIDIPIIFQFRLTDYWGDSSSPTTQKGRIGGVTSNKNMTVEKTLGLDFLINNEQVGLDLVFNAKYKNDSVYIPTVNELLSLNTISNVD